ncbi:ATP-binding protein [Pseudalkalibacillus salsuginis]|uniref:ATP-binding protein n=1 Tax=Pseudalkalibacillus salsuginis TaxID=2910972 RepID=UPI001F3FC4B2|nr:AAA family ATPase [Pseudalkalibacillus salsuginis]MCF6411026.1 AAA family ATPase [Pseudalkalibacillus salsuginis]
MRIKDLHIYGFGRFENEFIQFEDTDLQVIYGDNESGKSTLMAFMDYMLFGFPKRSEKRLRYEPKTTQAYGGKLRIETIEHGLLTVERKGGASGTVTILKEDGERVDEGFLSQLLGEVNHQAFHDVFSFNLDGLQMVNEIKSEQLGEYLFNAGLTGAQQLNEISTAFEENQNKRFKPNGKNPLLNQKLNNLQELEQNVKQWRKKLDEYNRMRAELADKKEELAQYERTKKSLQQKLTELQHIQSINPLIERKNTIEHQLMELPVATPFPEEGLERFRSLKERKIELIGDCEHTEDLIRKNEEETHALQLDGKWMHLSSEIIELESSYRLFKGRLEDYHKMEERIDYLQQEIDHEIRTIGQEWTEERIQSVKTDLVTKQQLMTRLKRFDQSKEDQKRLDEGLLQARELLETNEAKRVRIKKQILPEETVQSYREKVTHLSSQSPEFIKERIERLKSLQHPSVENPTSRITIWVLIVLGVVLAGIWIMNGDYAAGMIIGISLIGTGFLLHKNDGTGKGDLLEQQIKDLENELDGRHKSYDPSELDRLNQLILNQQQLVVQYEHLKEHERDLEKRYQEVARRYDEWEINHHRVKDELAEWRELCHMPVNVPDNMLLEIFDRISQLKKRLTERSHLKKGLEKLLGEITGYEDAVKKIADTVQIDSTQSIDKLMAQLSSRLDEEKKKRKERQSLTRSIADLREHHEGLKKKLAQYTQEIQKLFQKAEVHDEEAFRQKGKANDKYEKWTGQLQMVRSQLESTTDQKTIEHLEQNPEELLNLLSRLKESEEELEGTISIIDRLRDECSRLQATITHLEEDGTYSNQLHTLHLAKSEFLEEAKKWAVYRTAQHILDRAKRNFQAERQPRVINRAENYFFAMTEGGYTRIIAPKGEESFLIERNDGVIFRPEELSRATMEQLYLSLRIALAEEYENKGDFPLIMDDILVNFDEKRRKLAFDLIRSIAGDRQVLYFTCHGTTAAHLSGRPLRLPAITERETQTY